MVVKVAINGYGTIGKRVADAVTLQDDMEIVGVTKRRPTYEAKMAVKQGFPFYAADSEFVKGFELTKDYNSLIHGKPDSAPWNHVVLSDGSIGHASSKIINRPDLCDEVCAQVIPWVAVIQGMMAAYFPNKESAKQPY